MTAKTVYSTKQATHSSRLQLLDERDQQISREERGALLPGWAEVSEPTGLAELDYTAESLLPGGG